MKIEYTLAYFSIIDNEDCKTGCETNCTDWDRPKGMTYMVIPFDRSRCFNQYVNQDIPKSVHGKVVIIPSTDGFTQYYL